MCLTASLRPILPPQPGVYAVWLQVAEPLTVRVGSLGETTVTPGDWVYVGSALGPGGLRARVAHHARIASRPHWHIDYLRRHAVWTTVWYSIDSRRREHQWAWWFQEMGGVVLVPGFGASDCRCPAHLFHFPHRPDGAAFVAALRARYPDHPPVSL
jgi:Uri superfamily endonuclease